MPKMKPVTVQAGIETQPLTTEPASSSHRLHCLTANHHLLSTEQDGNRSPNRSLAREEENIKRDAVDLRRNSLSRKGLCLSLDLGLSSFELSLGLWISDRTGHCTAVHSAFHSSCEHTSKSFRYSWHSDQKPAMQGQCELQVRLAAILAGNFLLLEVPFLQNRKYNPNRRIPVRL